MKTAIEVIIILLSIIIGTMYHEYGHLKAAKKTGIKCTKYCIGIGKMLWSHKGKDGIEYGIAPFPVGGYCAIDDDELDAAPTKDFLKVMSGGVKNNIILFFILFIIGTIISQGIFNPITLIYKSVQMFILTIVLIFSSIGELFNFNSVVEGGGIVTGMLSTCDAISSITQTPMQIIGTSLMMGAVFNLMMAVLNAFPIPGLDGGQSFIRILQDVSQKLFHKQIPAKIIHFINTFFVVVLVGLQMSFFLLDIKPIQNFLLMSNANKISFIISNLGRIVISIVIVAAIMKVIDIIRKQQKNNKKCADVN